MLGPNSKRVFSCDLVEIWKISDLRLCNLLGAPGENDPATLEDSLDVAHRLIPKNYLFLRTKLTEPLWEKCFRALGGPAFLDLLVNNIVLELTDRTFTQVAGRPMTDSVARSVGIKREQFFVSRRDVRLDTVVNRERIFRHAHFLKHGGFPKSHVLNQVNASGNGARVLCCEISGIKGAPKPPKWTLDVLPGLVTLIQRNKEMNNAKRYVALLREYCPLPKCNFSGARTVVMKHQTPSHQVADFMLTCLNELVDFIKLFGSWRNWKEIKKKVIRFLRLQAHETLDRAQLEMNVRVSDISKNPFWRHNGIHRFLLWFFNRIVVPLLREHFYVTTCDTGHGTIYFRKVLWARAVHEADKELMATLTPLDPPNQRSFISRPVVSWVPKNSGLRPLLDFRAENRRLKPHVLIFFHLLRRHARLLGVSHAPHAESIRTHLRGILRQNTSSSPIRLAACDIATCFDKLPHDAVDHAFAALKDAVQSEGWCSTALRSVECSWPLTHIINIKRGVLQRSFRPLVVNSDFRTVVRRGHRAIVVHAGQRGRARVAAIDEALARIRDATVDRMVVVRGRRFAPTRGIPQGASWSHLLCSLILGTMEARNQHRVTARDDNAVVLRYVDDILMVTRKDEDEDTRHQPLHNWVRTVYNLRSHKWRTGKSIVWAGFRLTPTRRGTRFNVRTNFRQKPFVVRAGSTVRNIFCSAQRQLARELPSLVLDKMLNTPHCRRASITVALARARRGLHHAARRLRPKPSPKDLRLYVLLLERYCSQWVRRHSH